MNTFEKGSEWRKWDLHIHTPASFHWTGARFDSGNPDSQANIELVDEMIEALNNAEPAVFALMDYWTFDGWFALKNRLEQLNAPKLNKLVFPGIELRLVAPTKCRLNAHVLFSDKIENQVLHDFKSQLQIEIINRPLSNDGLITLARDVGKDKLTHHNFKKSEIDTDDNKALLAGSTIAEINCDSYKKAINNVPNGQAIGFMPFDTSDGLSEVEWKEHYAYVSGLFKTSPIFETRNSGLRSAFVGEETTENKGWFDNFQKSLKYIPRLAVSGSDAHRFVGIQGNNDKRGYGDFPSNKATWIKADPTFLGLLQAIKEPAKRSYIGEKPEKLLEIDKNNVSFVNSIKIKKNPDSSLSEHWLNGVNLSLNSDLVAIIGNKGSGKSALADVIALLGNSHQKEETRSFLTKKRFRGKTTNGAAKHFTAEINWSNRNTVNQNLNDNPPETNPELIRYIPQSYFEELCNEHVSGKSLTFQKELEKVIFEHLGEDIRLGALDFSQLLEQQESQFRSQLNEYRKELTELNKNIESLENQCHPEIKKSLEELLNKQNKDIEDHKAIKSDELEKPSEELSAEQQEVANKLDGIAQKLKEIEQLKKDNNSKRLLIAKKRNSIQSIRNRAGILERQYQQFQNDTANDFQVLDKNQTDVIFLKVDLSELKTIEENCKTQEEVINTLDANNEAQKEISVREGIELNKKLNEPQRQYQEYLKARKEWDAKLKKLIGNPETPEPETQRGLEKRISQLNDIPNQLKTKYTRREEITGEIFDTLNNQKKARESLYLPVQAIIEANQLIKKEYPLQFQVALIGKIDSLSSELISLIQRKGEFRGEDENNPIINTLVDESDINTKEGILDFTKKLSEKIQNASSNGNLNLIGIQSILRKNKSASSVYDLIYGLNYLEPCYSLSFQNTQIEQLSPGQRGALLLIFYLLIDKGHNPIILDQPEENLDNETVVNLLVPVLTEAKKKRQIIMVTHNPNLAVVCDAEQIIYASFDRKDGCKISYESGAIENEKINKHVVDVLEGTKPAFNNRKIKYI